MELFQDWVVIGGGTKMATSGVYIVYCSFVMVMSLGSGRKAMWQQGCGGHCNDPEFGNFDCTVA
ncbi:unnamed protein product [Prunus armeniaca]